MRTWSSTAGPTSAWGSSRPSRRARAGRARIATCSGFHSLRVERGAQMSENGEVRIDIESFGPGPEVNDEVSEAVLDHPSVQEYLDGTRHRLLSVRLLIPRSRASRTSRRPRTVTGPRSTTTPTTGQWWPRGVSTTSRA